MKKKGKLIVLEGIDGSGKTTQHKLLVKYLRSKGKTVKTIKFPQHGESFFGKMIDDLLANKYGRATKVDPHLTSTLFALDRWIVKSKIIGWLKRGHYVIPDRYTTSNLGHQLGKLMNQTNKVRNKFLKWDREMEYKILGIPKPDVVIYIELDFHVATQLIKKRKQASQIKRHDEHEYDLEYLKNAQKAYDYVYKHSKHWKKLNCMKNNELMSPQKIHENIVLLISKHL